MAGLQQGRDALLPTALVSTYYRLSPPVARTVGANSAVAAGVRGGLAPWAGWVGASASWILLLAALAGLGLVALRRRL